MRCVILLAAFFQVSLACGAEQVLWQIGRPDKSYREFACAGDYQSYPAWAHKASGIFEVGRSDPARDWPFIQPGPVDGWAHGALKPLTVRFKLDAPPRGTYLLRVEFVNVHYAQPPAFAVSVQGRSGAFQLQPGASDRSLTDPAAGSPQKLEIVLPAGTLKQGNNELRFACTSGSWVLYDAVSLIWDPQGKLPEPGVRGVTATATPLYLRHAGGAMRAVRVTVDLVGSPAEVTLQSEAPGQTSTVVVKDLPLLGNLTHELGVPDATEPQLIKVTARAGGSAKTATVVVPPARKWRVFVAPSSHTDIGYTHIQSECAERHCQNVDVALELLREHPDFRWNLEVAWQAERYLASRTGPQLEAFLQAAKTGKIGVQALYCNILTGLCSHEEACRLTAYAHTLHARYGIPYESAMISDVPSQEASLPMLLAGSGVRYFSSGINNDRAYPFREMQGKCPCWWEGPDGSRVLMMYVHGYSHAAQWALDKDLDAAKTKVCSNLASYERREDYPYDAVFLHGAVSDNQLLNRRLADVVEAWNQRYEFPKLLLCNNAEFFRYVEAKYGEKLPVYRGSAGTYWEDGAGSSARETTLSRNAHEDVANAEKFLALTDRLAGTQHDRRESIDAVWRNCMLYDEHTWGAHCSISQPESDFTRSQWKIKAQFAVDAAQGARELLKRGIQGMAALVRTEGPSLVVFNPASWPRTDVLQVELPEGQGIDDPHATLRNAPHGTFALVKDVPPCGYRVLKLVPQARPPRAQVESGHTIESRFYRVQFDPASGNIASILDKELRRELVDPQAPFRLNQFVYVSGGKGTRIVSTGPEAHLTLSTSGPATLRRLRRPGMGEMMLVETSAASAPKLYSAVVVWDDIKRIDLVNRITKTLTYDKEGVYFAFPFAAEKPGFRYEIPAGVVCANTDLLPGACREWFTVQHFVEVESRDAAVTWATPDAPLVCFQDINRGRWLTSLPLVNGHLYAYVMNNYWHTNYLAGQGGDFKFRFAITSRAKGDRPASARFGWEASNPLLAVVVGANPGARLPAGSGSLLSIDEPNVMLIACKQAEDRRGLIVRLWEVSGRPTTAHLRLGEVPGGKATACNLVEEPQGALTEQDGAIVVPIRGSGLATVRIE